MGKIRGVGARWYTGGGPRGSPPAQYPPVWARSSDGALLEEQGLCHPPAPRGPPVRGGTSRCELTRSVWGWSFWPRSRQKSGLFSAFFPSLGFYRALLLVPPLVLCWVLVPLSGCLCPVCALALDHYSFPFLSSSSLLPDFPLQSQCPCVCVLFFFFKKISS